jgi:hypothetical protein
MFCSYFMNCLSKERHYTSKATTLLSATSKKKKGGGGTEGRKILGITFKKLEK